MEYKSVKPMTIEAFMKAGGSCDEFKTNLNIFINNEIIGNVDLFEEFSLDDIIPCFRYYPRWEEWLIEKGFIEPAEMTFKVGQYFTHPKFPDSIMSISRTGTKVVNVIAHNLPGHYQDSNRITIDGLAVEYQNAITMAEMSKMTGFKAHELLKMRFCNIDGTAVEVM